MDQKVFLLFDAGCVACSRAAKSVESEAGGWLEVRDLRDGEIAQTLARAGLSIERFTPTIVVVTDERVRVLTGVPMRTYLAARFGPRKGVRVARLVAQAHQARRAAAGVPRRAFLGSALAGAAAVAASRLIGPFGPPAASADVLAPSTSLAEVQASTAAQVAQAAFGPLDWTNAQAIPPSPDAVCVEGKEEWSVPFVSNAESDLYSVFVYASAPEAGSSLAQTISTAVAATNDPNLFDPTKVYTIAGDNPVTWTMLTTDGRQLFTSQLAEGANPNPVPTPLGIEWVSEMATPDTAEDVLVCFVDCVGAFLGDKINCFLACVHCVETLHFATCAICAVCTNFKGFSCLTECLVLLGLKPLPPGCPK